MTAPGPLHAGIDGEAVELDPPLRFVIGPRALRVRLPRPQNDEARQASRADGLRPP